jgi:hypothetical protein
MPQRVRRRRLPRLLLNTATVVSLVLCGTLLVCWRQSTVAYHHLYYTTWQDDLGVERSWGGAWWGGRLFAGRTVRRLHDYVPGRQSEWDYLAQDWAIEFRRERPDYFHLYRLNRFRYEAGKKYEAPDDSVNVSLRIWPLVVVTALLPAYRLLRYGTRRRRRDAGLCPACGYDLRATPGRCPECGTVPTEAR